MTTYTVVKLIETNQHARVVVDHVTVSDGTDPSRIEENGQFSPYKQTTIAIFEGRLKNLVGGGKELT